MKSMIVVMTYAGSTAPSFTGPFADYGASGKWGRKWQAQNNDEPRWQVLDVPAGFFNQAPAISAPN